MSSILRVGGDMTHLLSIFVLISKIRSSFSCSGISLKTQELYVIVFLTRYLDLFTRYVSLYNTVMKLVFLGSSFAIVWYMRYHKVVKQTYNIADDSFRIFYLLLPCFVLALLFHRDSTFFEVLWTFSLYLEAVVIIPQLVMLQRSRNIDNLTGKYIFLLGVYRVLYVLNWIYRYFLQDHRTRWIPWISGLVQTALYADFFYYYIVRLFFHMQCLRSWLERQNTCPTCRALVVPPENGTATVPGQNGLQGWDASCSNRFTM